MGTTKKAILVFVLPIILFTSRCVARTGLTVGECAKPDDCGPGECCVLGMQRYATAECRRLGTIDEHCRVGATPEEGRFLYYPNLIIQYIEGVYLDACPCNGLLQCIDNTCTTSSLPEDK